MRSRSLASTALALTSLALLPQVAAAEDAPLDAVIVTATRLPAPTDEVTGARVVDHVELQQRGAPFVSDILSTLPGVAVARTGAFGGVTTIRIRGASPDKTLVLVDGMPVGDASDPSGAYDAGALQTPDLERIEVLSGPQSSLWGSEAIGGVVSLTTRELRGPEADLEAGAYGTVRLYGGVGRADEAGAVSASVTAYRSDGISKADQGRERDGLKSVTANLAGRTRVNDRLSLDGRLRFTASDIEIDGFAPPTFALGDTPDRAKSRTWQGAGRVTLDAGGFVHAFSVGAYDLHRRSISSFPATFDADRQVYRWTATRGESLVLGAERQESSAALSSGLTRDLSNTAVFGVARARLQRLTFTGSVRHDDPEAFASRTTGRAAVAADLGLGFSAVASVGSGSKTPTVSQAVCDFCYAPPAPLRPEKAEGQDLRLAWTGGPVSAAITAYRLQVRDQISYVAGRYVNIARTRSNGLEAEAQAQLGDAVRLRLAYAYLDAVDRTTGASLLRVPDHSGSAALFWTGDRWSGALTVRGESAQSDTARDGFSRAVRKGFVTADVSGSYALNPRVSLTARVENVADRRFSEVLGYGEPGAAAYFGVRIRN